MSIQAPDLIIPVRYDYGKGAADVRAASAQATQATKQAADDQAKAAKDGDKKRQQSARETAAFIAKSNKDIADRGAAAAKAKADAETRAAKESAAVQTRAAKDAASEESRAAKSASMAKRRADREAFREWKAGQDLRHRQTMQAWQEEQAAVKNNENAVASLIKAHMGLSTVKGIASALSDEFQRAADYTRELAKNFSEVRKALEIVQGLQNKPPTNKATLEEVEKAEAAGMKPEVFAKAKEAFLNKAAGQLKGPHAKMTEAEGEQFMTQVAQLAVAKGYDSAVAMDFAGAILQQSKGEITVPEAMKQFNQSFINLQEGPIDPRVGVGMMSGIMAHGLSAQEASTALNIVSPVARPGEELTSVEGALRAVEEMRTTGKGEQFGVTNKMTQYEALKAFGRNIVERERKLRAGGMVNDNEIDVEIARQLKEADVAAEIREKRGLVRGFARRGVEMGEFEQNEANIARISPDADKEIVRGFRASQRGREASREARDAAATARRGAIHEPIEAEREESRIKLKNEGVFEHGSAGRAARNIFRIIPGVPSPEEQEINEETVRRLREQARNVGARPAYIPGNVASDYLSSGPKATNAIDVSDVKARSQEDVNAEIRDLLRAIKVANERMLALAAQGKPTPLLVGGGIMPLAAGGVR